MAITVQQFMSAPVSATFGFTIDQLVPIIVAANITQVNAYGGSNPDNVRAIAQAVQQAGMSPAWFFAYAVQEDGTGGPPPYPLSWLNHYGSNPSSNYAQAAALTAQALVAAGQAGAFPPANGGGIDMSADQIQQAQAVMDGLPNGSIGRAYISETSAATAEAIGLANDFGTPMSDAATLISSWGGTFTGTAGPPAGSPSKPHATAPATKKPVSQNHPDCFQSENNSKNGARQSAGGKPTTGGDAKPVSPNPSDPSDPANPSDLTAVQPRCSQQNGDIPWLDNYLGQVVGHAGLECYGAAQFWLEHLGSPSLNSGNASTQAGAPSPGAGAGMAAANIPYDYPWGSGAYANFEVYKGSFNPAVLRTGDVVCMIGGRSDATYGHVMIVKSVDCAGNVFCYTQNPTPLTIPSWTLADMQATLTGFVRPRSLS